MENLFFEFDRRELLQVGQLVSARRVEFRQMLLTAVFSVAGGGVVVGIGGAYDGHDALAVFMLFSFLAFSVVTFSVVATFQAWRAYRVARVRAGVLMARLVGA